MAKINTLLAAYLSGFNMGAVSNSDEMDDNIFNKLDPEFDAFEDGYATGIVYKRNIQKYSLGNQKPQVEHVDGHEIRLTPKSQAKIISILTGESVI